MLSPHELRLFAAAPLADRAHGLTVARRVAEMVGDDPRWQRAALLHDTGKSRADLGVAGRAAVTAVAVLAPAAAARWEEEATAALSGGRLLGPVPRWRKGGAYLAHGPLAGAWLARHGTEEEVTSWVSAHHQPDLWPELPIPAPVVGALAEADE